MKLRQLLQGLEIVGCAGDADREGEVSSVCYAASQCGKDSLFVAIPGLAHDGHDFIGEAVERGARYIVYSREMTFPDGIVAIRVADSRRALGRLARNFFGDPSSELTLVGITGTSGKTTVSYLLESMLSAAGFGCGVLGTVNYRFGGKVLPAPNTTPESCDMQKILREMADAGVTHVIAEISSHALDLRRVDECDFDLGIFTNLSPEHLDYHRDMEDYFRAKKRLFAELLALSNKPRPQKAVVNADDPWGQRLVREAAVPLLTYGLEGQSDITVAREEHSLDGIRADILLTGRILPVTSRLIGRFNLSNILAATAAATLLGAEPAAIEAGIRNLRQVPGRLERVQSPAGIHVFVDYAHKPDALTQVLETLTQLKQKRILTVFGCGGNRDRAKRPLMGQTATALSDLTIITSDNPRREDPLAIIGEIEAGVDPKEIEKTNSETPDFIAGRRAYTVIADRKAAIDAAIGLAGPGDIVLIAGKGHEDYQILATKKIAFDDRVAAAEALHARFAGCATPVFSVADVLAATGGQLAAGNADTLIYGISTDSRTVRPGNLFVALTGERFDGHAFVAGAVDDKAAAVIVAAGSGIRPETIGMRAAVIVVEDTLRALGDLANAYRRRFSIPVVGLTGSSGKTTTREMLCSILALERNVLKTEGNLNNLIGLPQTIFRLTGEHDIAVLEMGTNTRGEIERLARIAEPDIGLITNIGPAHLAGFGSVATVREEKGDLFANVRKTGTTVVNLDDEAVCEAANRWSGRRVTFSMSAAADVGLSDIRKNGVRGAGFNLLIGKAAHRVEMKVAGIHSLYNAIAAAATALACGASVEAIRRGLALFTPVSGRMEIVRLQNGAYIINDAYNANPASVREALLTLKDLKNGHNAYVFLGDMLELGDAAPEMHRKVGLLLATIGVAAVFLQGDFASVTAEGARVNGLDEGRIFLLKDDEEALAFLKKALRKGDWVLVKGSRRMKMDRIAARLIAEVGVAGTQE
ncbi:MAG: UDP-N-acetylmuramoyl-L-alanyl-D-glutamate--2,6-diaminopimelate ligase [Smithellaceae bacterium]|nr:UDP-N-acetylmuramoyl-L-alanyl-D-glutamate--2,6-diaminopimelate ligase [Syntrophaceae bacterium]MDD4241190.1 UDP-N-acetylmuramoyl-L-alanyl-D-glutamate--2,6-diaminopimelate ligase [Smithellaceae bacterium]NLX51550.1 UDP-N-acetylmuramoyl-L-alanyl-D-glutamate--2,6-diaminopimelate ligase [Deltaproteobacteria bacterium]